jgi:hypothetical protein
MSAGLDARRGLYVVKIRKKTHILFRMSAGLDATRGLYVVKMRKKLNFCLECQLCWTLGGVCTW